MKQFLRSGLLALAAAVGAYSSTAANAVIIATETFQLTSDHCTGNCLPGGGSAGLVTVNQNSDGTLSFDVSLNSGFRFVNTGFDVAFAFNLFNDPTLTYTTISTGYDPLGGSPQPASVDQSGVGTIHVDGTGYFDYGVVCTACGSGGSNAQPGPLDFTIDAAINLTLANLQQNPDGQFFVVDVLAPNGNTGPIDASSGTISCSPTGPVPCGGGTQEPIPEPSSIAALGGALALFGIWYRRRMSA
jgi:hypothetical protein